MGQVEQLLGPAGAAIEAHVAERVEALADASGESLSAVERRLAEVEQRSHHEHPAPPDGGDETPPDASHGRREGPRPVDPAPWLEGLTPYSGGTSIEAALRAAPKGLDLGGRLVRRDELPRWAFDETRGKVLANLRITNGDPRLQVALYVHDTPGAALVGIETDQTFGGTPQNIEHIAVIDANRSPDLEHVNLRVADGDEHGIEIAGRARVLGVDVAGRQVGLSGNADGALLEDSRFRFLEAHREFNDHHHGAVKLGGRGDGSVARRCEFHGTLWLDVGQRFDLFEDCLFGGGAHIEILGWYDLAHEAPVRFRHCTHDWSMRWKQNQWWFGRFDSGGRLNARQGFYDPSWTVTRNPSHIQWAHLNAHAGAIDAEDGLINLDLGSEWAFTEWDDNQTRGGKRAPSAIRGQGRMTSDGTRVARYLIDATKTDLTKPIHGGLARISHGEWVEWSDVHLLLPGALRDRELFAVENRWMTVAQFIERYPTTTVDWV